MSRPSPAVRRFAFVIASVVIVGALITSIALRRRATADEISPRRFSSDKLPAVSFLPPEGWRLEYFEQEGKLIARQGHANASIETSWLNGTVDPQAIIERFIAGFRDYHFEIGPTFAEPFRGKDALGLSVKSHTQKTSVWVIKRGERLVTTIMCAFEAQEVETRGACKDVFASLEWRTPTAPAR